MAIIENFEINGESYDIVDNEAVHFTSQNLTAEQKNQARENIGTIDKNVLNYSEFGVEKKTGSRWSNGKSIYRVIIETGAKTSNTKNFDVSAYNIEHYISLRGMFYKAANYGDDYVFPAPAVHMNNAEWTIQLEAVDRTELTLSADSRTWQSGMIFIEYTKTTDESESGEDSGSDNGLSNAAAIVDLVYPVGSIYMSINSVSPETLFGGTWEQIKDTFLLSAGDTYEGGTSGGNAEHTHDASGYAHIAENGTQSIALENIEGVEAWTSNFNFSCSSKKTEEVSRTRGAITTTTIENASNMPPYLTVYMWKRTA